MDLHKTFTRVVFRADEQSINFDGSFLSLTDCLLHQILGVAFSNLLRRSLNFLNNFFLGLFFHLPPPTFLEIS